MICGPLNSTAERTPKRWSQPPRVLVVEDDYIIATSIVARVRESGAVVIGPFRSIGDARRRLQTEHPDAAILNFRLDGNTTLDLARDLIRSGCPVIFVSGYAQRGEVPDDLRACRWLDKPDISDKLGDAIDRMLADRDP